MNTKKKVGQNDLLFFIIVTELTWTRVHAKRAHTRILYICTIKGQTIVSMAFQYKGTTINYKYC